MNFQKMCLGFFISQVSNTLRKWIFIVTLFFKKISSWAKHPQPKFIRLKIESLFLCLSFGKWVGYGRKPFFTFCIFTMLKISWKFSSTREVVGCTRVPSQKIWIWKNILAGFYSRKSVFFTLFLPLTAGFPSKNRMLLTHPQHDFKNFWKHFCWLYSNVNTPYKRQVWPKPRRAKVALLTYFFTFCNFCGSPITWLNSFP